MKQLFFIVLTAFLVSVLLFLSSCSRSISGVVKEVKGDTLTLSNGYKFKVNKAAPIGDTVKFKATYNRKKVNSRPITNK